MPVFKQMVWPPPPETPRIRFVGTVSRPQDLGIYKSFFQKAVDYLSGKGPVGMGSPYGVAADNRGRIYVVDTEKQKIHVFDTVAGRYTFFPEKNDILSSPIGIALEENSDRVFVTDSVKGEVMVFEDFGNRLVSKIAGKRLKRPTGIAVNPKSEQLLVVDTLQSSIFRFSLKTLEFLGTLSKEGTAPGELHSPTNICVAPDSSVIVSDSLNFRIQVFSENGEHVNTFGGPGDNPGSFARPRGVACDSDGNIYVVDALFDNIQIFDHSGRLLMAFGGHGAGYGEFWLPTGIHIDRQDRIYVSDASNRRIQIFKYIKQNRQVQE